MFRHSEGGGGNENPNQNGDDPNSEVESIGVPPIVPGVQSVEVRFEGDADRFKAAWDDWLFEEVSKRIDESRRVYIDGANLSDTLDPGLFPPLSDLDEDDEANANENENANANGKGSE